MHRHEARENRPIAQLAIGVKTPGPDCAVVLERQAVAATGGNSQEPAQVLYSHRRETLGAVPSPSSPLKFEPQAQATLSVPPASGWLQVCAWVLLARGIEQVTTTAKVAKTVRSVWF